MVDSLSHDISPDDRERLTISNKYGSKISIEDSYSGAGNGSSKAVFKVIKDRISLNSCISDGVNVCNSEIVEDNATVFVDSGSVCHSALNLIKKIILA